MYMPNRNRIEIGTLIIIFTYLRSAILVKSGVPKITIKMEIRDSRDKEWFWLDNEYLNGYAKHLGSTASLVYISLCRHSDNKTQKCYPSMELIAEELGMQRASISRAIAKLAEWRILEIKEDYDKKNKRRKNNVYTLTKKSEWKEKPCNNKLHGKDESHVTIKSEPCNNDDESHVTQSYSNKTNTNKTHLTIAETSSAEVVSIIDLFKPINPEYCEWYRNNTQRKAIAYLIEKYGFQKVSNMVTQLPQIISRKYAPKIMTPHELKRDLGKLLLFIKQETPKTTKIGKL